jgi:toxin ParE1/3/4
VFAKRSFLQGHAELAQVRLSRRAEADLLEIAAYSLEAWGEERAIAYINGLEESLRLLAVNPRLGRSCDDVLPGLRCMESGKHVAFYREEAGGILVSRILHWRTLPERPALDEEAG